jgi:hypothetical protein
MSKLLRTVSFASASLKTLALAIVLVLCGANTVFAQSIVCPESADVNCNQDLPMATFADLEGSGYTASMSFSDAVISGSGCDVQIARTYTATFTSADDSYTEMCTVVHRVADFEAPVFVDAPGDATYECIDEVPAPSAVSAQDDCNNPVVVELFENESSINDTLVCNDITTPDAFGPDEALWLNGLNAAGLTTRYSWSGTPSLIFSANGEARLVGDVFATNGAGYGWHVDITLEDGVDWTAWSGNGGQIHWGEAPISSPFETWSFYKMVATISRLEGLGSLAGSQLILTHQDYSYGFQFGAVADGSCMRVILTAPQSAEMVTSSSK